MTLSDELQKNGWNVSWIEDEKTRELLMKIFSFDGIRTSADAMAIAATLALEYKLEKEVNFSISDWNVVAFLNAYNDGPLDERFYALAKAIDDKFAELPRPLN